jgi:hypothetical protein
MRLCFTFLELEGKVSLADRHNNDIINKWVVVMSIWFEHYRIHHQLEQGIGLLDDLTQRIGVGSTRLEMSSAAHHTDSGSRAMVNHHVVWLANLATELETDPPVALATTTAGQVVGEEEWVELSQLIYLPKKGLHTSSRSEMTAWQALKLLLKLTVTVPVGLQGAVGYLLKWAHVACTMESATSTCSALHVKWQGTPPGDRDVLEWQQRWYAWL